MKCGVNWYDCNYDNSAVSCQQNIPVFNYLKGWLKEVKNQNTLATNIVKSGLQLIPWARGSELYENRGVIWIEGQDAYPYELLEYLKNYILMSK